MSKSALKRQGPVRPWQRLLQTTGVANRALVIAAILSLSACGGGGGGGGGSGGGNSNPPPPAPGPAPTLAFTADVLQVAPGQPAYLTWESDASTCTASGGWSGAKSANGIEVVGPMNVTTDFNLSCSNANSPATAASVTVTVPEYELPPPPTLSRVTSDLARTTLDYQRVAIGIRDIAWDPQQSLFYAVTRPDSMTAPNSLVSIDPVTLAMRVRPLASEPWSVAVSHDGAYTFVGYRHGGTVQRYLADDLVADITIQVGNAESWVQQIVPSPVSDKTIAVSVNKLDTRSSDPVGIVIVDDNVVLPDKFHGSHRFSPTVRVSIDINDVDWTPDGTRIYGVLRSRGVVELDVTNRGVDPVSYHFWPLFGEKVSLHGNKLLAVGGRVFDLAGPIDQVGQYAYANFSSGDHVFSESRGKVFSSHTAWNGPVLDGKTINSFDPESYTLIDSITFNGPAFVDYSTILLWGSDGIAIRSEEELVIAHGTFAAAGGLPAPLPDVLTVTHNTRLGGPGGLSVKSLNIGALDVATNPCGELYVSTAAWAAELPNSVLQLDPSNAAVLRVGTAGNDAGILAASDDCTTLYAGRQYSNSIARIRLEDLAVVDEIPTGAATNGLTRARAISVMPGQAQTVAVARGEMAGSYCSGSAANMQIFDGAVPRPVSIGERDIGLPSIGPQRIMSVVWGNRPDVLYAEDWNFVYAVSVDASGPSSIQAVMPNRMGTSIDNLGRDLQFDRGRNRVFNSTGYFYDVDAGVEMGPIPLINRPAIYVNCSTPGQVMTTDPDTGRIFWVSISQDDQYSIAVHSPDSLELIVGTSFPSRGRLGVPMKVVRPTPDTLAIVTTNAYLVLLQGLMLEP